MKRSDWWIGKILKSIKSKGDKIRSVKVDVIPKDKIITLKRPINKLFHIQFTNQKNKELNFSNEGYFLNRDNKSASWNDKLDLKV